MGRLFFLLFFIIPLCAIAKHVEIADDALLVDGKRAPYLFGAEVQYFRARGGSGRNVSPEAVEKLWNKMLDRVQEAKMNAVTFYIPWDFHEPLEGVFDFDGTLDQDGDHKPDYPSRNLKKFMELVKARGIRYVMIRPGPYINAEWGPTGFGAVPKWFLEKYPEALSVTQTAGKPKTVSFHHPAFRERAAKWFRELYRQVLHSHIGPGKEVVFLQIDNETNYFWDTIYERDWHPGALSRYRDFLKTQYGGDIQKLNAAYEGSVDSFEKVQAPVSPSDKRYPNGAWHYDWFHFHDLEILDYYRFLRKTWEDLGVNEPDVLFTSCDSFNAFSNGLLPRLDYRQTDKLSLTTMNIYPKTSGTTALSTLNNPMKGAHDALLVGASHRQYYGTARDWVMSTETMGGWFPPTEVSLASREHTYGSLLASGVKALILYYFHEGWNWTGDEKSDSELQFDAPLDKDMNPRPAFQLLKKFGEALEQGLGSVALSSRTPTSTILIAHDSGAQYSSSTAVDPLKIASTDSASLFGHLRESGFSPELGFIEAMTSADLRRYKVIYWDHPGYLTQATKSRLEDFLTTGGTLISMGKIGLIPKTGQHLIVLDKNPALGWNEDEYLRLPHPKKSLSSTRDLLVSSGLTPDVEVSTQDGKPFLHTWTRPTKTGKLVAVENFLPSNRVLHLKFPKWEKNGTYRWRRLWGRGASKEFEVTAEDLSKYGAKLSAEADSISLWLVEEK